MKPLNWYVALILLIAVCPARSDELALRQAIRTQARDLLMTENFAGLERTARSYNNEDKRTPSGGQKINLFEDGLRLVLETPGNATEQYCFEMEEKIGRWIKAYPESTTAHLAFALALVEHSMFFRGGGYANTVPKRAWEPYLKYQNLAYDYLTKHKKIAGKDLGWYSMMLGVGRSLGWEQKRMEMLVEEAFAKGDTDDRIYYGMLESLAPKWGGSAEQIDKFVEHVVARTKNQRGMEMYARLYSGASQSQYQHQLFNQSKANWPKMKSGFEDILKRYPDIWNVNIYAHFSCLAGDKEKTKELMGIIGDHPALVVWEPDEEKIFNGCRRWALGSQRLPS